MKYWDASALVTLLVRQDRSKTAQRLLLLDPDIVTWWGSATECYSALMRLVRENRLAPSDFTAAEKRLLLLRQAWHEVQPRETVRKTAERLLRLHPLRAADALQLAAALSVAGQEPDTLDWVGFDARLNTAARGEGFPVWANGTP